MNIILAAPTTGVTPPPPPPRDFNLLFSHGVTEAEEYAVLSSRLCSDLPEMNMINYPVNLGASSLGGEGLVGGGRGVIVG